MAKNTEKTEQEVRWDAFLDKFEKSNPTKFATRKEAGQLEMPKDF